jgi:hypothetical protein
LLRGVGRGRCRGESGGRGCRERRRRRCTCGGCARRSGAETVGLVTPMVVVSIGMLGGAAGHLRLRAGALLGSAPAAAASGGLVWRESARRATQRGAQDAGVVITAATAAPAKGRRMELLMGRRGGLKGATWAAAAVAAAAIFVTVATAADARVIHSVQQCLRSCLGACSEGKHWVVAVVVNSGHSRCRTTRRRRADCSRRRLATRHGGRRGEM